MLSESYLLIEQVKIARSVFSGPHSKTVLRNEIFKGYLRDIKLRAWSAFKAVVQGFLGKNKHPNYEILLRELLYSYQVIGDNMS